MILWKYKHLKKHLFQLKIAREREKDALKMARLSQSKPKFTDLIPN